MIREMTVHFLSLNSFFLRYRYNATLATFLTQDHLARNVLPATHIRKLKISIRPPEGIEDDEYDDECEYEWRHLFPIPRNAKCSAYRAQLEADLVLVREVVNQQCSVELMVHADHHGDALLGTGFEGEGGLKDWLVGLAASWRDRGKSLSVKIVEPNYTTTELEF